MAWHSDNKDKLEVGKIYWVYFMERSNKYNLLRNHTGLFQVKVIKHEKHYGTGNYSHLFSVSTEFEIIDNVKFSPTMNHNIRAYLNGYGMAQCTFSESYDELVAYHDNELKEWSRNLNTKDRSLMLSKLIIKEAPVQSKIEKETMAWLGTLSQKELKYVWWVKEYFEGLDKLIK